VDRGVRACTSLIMMMNSSDILALVSVIVVCILGSIIAMIRIKRYTIDRGKFEKLEAKKHKSMGNF
jgi:hypothetical protein